MGLFSWLIVEPSSAFGLTPEFALVGLGASLIDIDHFIAARSLRISGAMQAPHRGIFHCSGLFLLLSLLLFPFDVNWACVLLISFGPHHLRDATRRGIYLYPPLIHTRPISKNLVRILIPCFSWLIWLVRIRYWSLGSRSPETFGYKKSFGSLNNAFVV